MQEKDIYDIIIENATKEWYSSMNNNISNDKWEIPRYSRNQIDKAGKKIVSEEVTLGELGDALEVLNNWRFAHVYPLQVIADNLRRNNPDAIVVQRLKRLDSIIAKIKRNAGMSLYNMQDLGGCRVIVDSIEQVYETISRYKDSRIRHILRKENDYIQEPKKSGYRSYHMIYQFHSDDNETYNKNMLIEVQVRTKLQHIWATAVEVMGIYTKSQLKASMGDEDILRFFVLVSSVFATIEKMPVCPNTIDDYDLLVEEIKAIDNKLQIVSILSAINVAIKHTNDNMKGKGYYLLQLDLKKKMLNVNGFTTGQIELANKIYNEMEALKNPNMDVVLVSATSFDTLKEAYPNYFTDISRFVEMMRELLK
ncbi:MAG: hypothetical protein E7290_09345 [Lachnospiraceae bacterium]|nr:hypothetical protein [Lachnospiraceae bacterium]